MANQQAAQQMSEQGDRQASMSFQNKMNALQQLGNLSGQQRGQEYGEKSDKARAQDVFSQFNRQAAMGTQQRNVDRQNQAQQSNLQTKQGLENMRSQLANQQELHNKGLIQQDFQNRLQKAGGQSGQYQSFAQAEQQTAANKAKMVGDIIGGGSKFAGAAMSDVNMKENIEDGDRSIERMMDELDAYEYDYKQELNEPGRKVSVMAQDLERSDMGNELVEDTDMGKMVDYEKAAPVTLAATANLNKRMKRLEKYLLGEDEE
jgi:hypothetical protein